MSQKLANIAMVAKANFERNADTLVAGFLIRNPDIKPEDVELVMSITDGSMRFSIEPKELHVPDKAYRQQVDPEYDKSDEWKDHGANTEQEYAAYRAGHCDGWNDCRQAMIDATTKARPADAMVATLDTMTDALVNSGVAIEAGNG